MSKFKLNDAAAKFLLSLAIGGLIGAIFNYAFKYRTKDVVQINQPTNLVAITPENTFPAVKRASVGFNYDLICAAWTGETENKDVTFFVRLPGDPPAKFRMLSIGSFGWTANKKLYFSEINSEKIQSLEAVYPDITGLTCE